MKKHKEQSELYLQKGITITNELYTQSCLGCIYDCYSSLIHNYSWVMSLAGSESLLGTPLAEPA